MKRTWVGAIVLLAFFGLALPASADSVTIAYSGPWVGPGPVTETLTTTLLAGSAPSLNILAGISFDGTFLESPPLIFNGAAGGGMAYVFFPNPTDVLTGAHLLIQGTEGGAPPFPPVTFSVHGDVPPGTATAVGTTMNFFAGPNGFDLNGITDSGNVLWDFRVSGLTPYVAPPVNSVPEPGTLALLGVGLSGILLRIGRKRSGAPR